MPITGQATLALVLKVWRAMEAAVVEGASTAARAGHLQSANPRMSRALVWQRTVHNNGKCRFHTNLVTTTVQIVIVFEAFPWLFVP